MAYQLSQKQGRETVLRGGFGLFYDLGNTSLIDNLSFSFPFVRRRILTNVPFPLTPAQLAPPTISPGAPPDFLTTSDPNLKLPLTYQWNLALEQSLGADQTVSASYVAAIGRRLLRQETLVNPNPNFGRVTIAKNTGSSDYHAMQLQYQRRLSKGLQALASYTWSHSIDTGSNDSFSFAPTEQINPRQERGASDFDVRHAFSAAITYNLPTPSVGRVGKAIFGNWSVDTIFRARSATPVNVVTGTAIFGVTNVLRPDLVIGIPLYLDDSFAAGGRRRINNTVDPNRPGCKGPFCPPSAGRQGSLGRNALRGFSVNQVDFTLRRQFNLAERVKLQFRVEFFNLFNHPNFGDPVNNFSSGLFGLSTQMLGRSLGAGGQSGGFNPLYQVGGPRSIQLALKLQF